MRDIKQRPTPNIEHPTSNTEVISGEVIFTGGNGEKEMSLTNSPFPRFAPVLRTMHTLFSKASELTEIIIGGAIEVHRSIGPGLIESIYEWCLLKELGLRGLKCETQKLVIVKYKGFTPEEPSRFDVLVEDSVLVEAKAVQDVLPIHKAQLLSYMKLMDVPVGLLINFHEMKLINGVHRLLLPGANDEGIAANGLL
jgi:GxxExxY protein